MSQIPVRVAVRVRPLIQKEMYKGSHVAVTTDEKEPSLWVGKDKFTFDYVSSMADPDKSLHSGSENMISHLYKGIVFPCFI